MAAKELTMFSLFKRRNTNPADLLTSGLYNESHFYAAFVRDLKKAKSEVIIESPYLSCRRTDELLPIFRKLVRKGVKVRINTRNPNHHNELLRIQGWKCFKQLRMTDVKIKLCNDFRHRKIAVIDRQVLWEGSLNILSQSNSREVMRRTHSEALCKQMIRFIGLNRWYW